MVFCSCLLVVDRAAGWARMVDVCKKPQTMIGHGHIFRQPPTRYRVAGCGAGAQGPFVFLVLPGLSRRPALRGWLLWLGL